MCQNWQNTIERYLTQTDEVINIFCILRLYGISHFIEWATYYCAFFVNGQVNTAYFMKSAIQLPISRNGQNSYLVPPIEQLHRLGIHMYFLGPVK